MSIDLAWAPLHATLTEDDGVYAFTSDGTGKAMVSAQSEALTPDRYVLSVTTKADADLPVGFVLAAEWYDNFTDWGFISGDYSAPFTEAHDWTERTLQFVVPEGAGGVIVYPVLASSDPTPVETLQLRAMTVAPWVPPEPDPTPSTARLEIAAAASTVEGITVTPNYRQALTQGQGFVRLAHRDRPENGFGWIDTWQVWVALSQDIASAEQFLEGIEDDLLDALGEAMQVNSLTPSELVIDQGSVPGLVIEGVRGV